LKSYLKIRPGYKYIKRGTSCSKFLLSTKAPKQSSSAHLEDKKAVLQDSSLDDDFPSPPPYSPTNLQNPSQVLSLPHTRSKASYHPTEPGPLAEGSSSGPSVPILLLWQTPRDGAPFNL
jgi:hypothetical protein